MEGQTARMPAGDMILNQAQELRAFMAEMSATMEKKFGRIMMPNTPAPLRTEDGARISGEAVMPPLYADMREVLKEIRDYAMTINDCIKRTEA